MLTIESKIFARKSNIQFGNRVIFIFSILIKKKIIKKRKIKSNLNKYELFLTISCFPFCISIDDLKYLQSKDKIPKEWSKLLVELI